jgi:NADPH-dependent 2,4-dienoyl-CoA reductase/sulfur reductase-like enzyme
MTMTIDSKLPLNPKASHQETGEQPMQNRRDFLKTLGLGLGALAMPAILRAATAPHVVVVGGGFGGATAAKYLKHWSPNLQVTLIEPNANYYSCVLSNLVVVNELNMDRITFDYAALQSRYGVNVMQDRVAGINTAAQTLSLASGGSLAYDRLILSPGVQFDSIPGLDTSKVPHAWKAGDQTLLLRQQLQAMPNGGNFVMTVPAAPYRCPPGPYERACAVADFIKRHKPGGKVTLLDANGDITAAKHTFSTAFNGVYAGIIDYRTNVSIEGVDSNARVLTTNLGEFDADVLNVIPSHRAPDLVAQAGLANSGGNRWAGVNPLSYESTAVANVHIIGDAQGTAQPKAGHIANSEAKVCADAVIRLLNGQQPMASPKTNSACYTPITADTASFLTGVFRYDAASGSMKGIPESMGEAATPTREYYEEMFDWAENLFQDTFAAG